MDQDEQREEEKKMRASFVLLPLKADYYYIIRSCIYLGIFFFFCRLTVTSLTARRQMGIKVPVSISKES